MLTAFGRASEMTRIVLMQILALLGAIVALLFVFYHSMAHGNLLRERCDGMSTKIPKLLNAATSRQNICWHHNGRANRVDDKIDQSTMPTAFAQTSVGLLFEIRG